LALLDHQLAIPENLESVYGLVIAVVVPAQVNMSGTVVIAIGRDEIGGSHDPRVFKGSDIHAVIHAESVLIDAGIVCQIGIRQKRIVIGFGNATIITGELGWRMYDWSGSSPTAKRGSTLILVLPA
jgi:hypothetical protein